MERKELDIIDGINLTKVEKELFDLNRDCSNIIINIIAKRIERGLSQRDLANLSGIKQPMIARIETFDSLPRLDTLMRLAKALNLKISVEDELAEKINIKMNIKYRVCPKCQTSKIKFDNSFYDSNKICSVKAS